MRREEVVIITPELYLEGEERVVDHITSSGGIVHIRKPHSTQDELLDYSERVAKSGNKTNLSIHYNLDIALKVGLGGCHIPLSDLKLVESKDIRLSCSTHSLEEALNVEESSIDYYFLSPIFDSISKVGYRSSFMLSELTALLQGENRCVALGGVTAKNINLLSKFHSVALIGGVWVVDNNRVDVERSIDQFEKIKRVWQELEKYNI